MKAIDRNKGSASTVGRARVLPSSFVGRTPEINLLAQWLREAEGGRGRVVMIAGEPGIGKTRLFEEFAERARQRRCLVLGGACYEGEAGRACAPFAEGLDFYVRSADEAALRTEVAAYAGVLARFVPRLRTRLPDVKEPVALQPDEERTRLFDAVSQWLTTLARRTPLLWLLDDLHWADDDTIALLRHVARCLGNERLLLAGAYRSGEAEEARALGEALAILRRQTSFECIGLKGLAGDDVGVLLQALAEQRTPGSAAATVDPTLVQTLLAETNGNPFFVRSVVLNLIEAGKLRVDGGSWRPTGPIEEIGLPEGVRQRLSRRLGRLSPEARSLLTVDAVIGAAFRFDVATAVAELDEERALAAQLIAGTTATDSYAFVHALVRQALVEALNPSRQARLHRRIAEGMERVYGERVGEHAAEIAAHYQASSTMVGAERGVAHAIKAADAAERAAAHDEASRFLRIAVNLLPAGDPRRARCSLGSG